jgi:hypothetical protein
MRDRLSQVDRRRGYKELSSRGRQEGEMTRGTVFRGRQEVERTQGTVYQMLTGGV